MSATPIHVWGDPAALARIVGNLIDNAVKYGGEAAVTLWQAGTQTAIQTGTQVGTQVGTEAGAEAIMLVDDRGPGVPGAERERIFEPFLRLEASRNRDRGGAGLGLAIARHLVLSLGGIIAVEDRPGGGARFRVTLPARQ